jgi:hypothetical protein
MPKTYTVLITVSGREPADLTALAQRVKADLETGTSNGASYEAAEVDAFEGDYLAVSTSGGDLAGRIRAQRLHRELRKP